MEEFPTDFYVYVLLFSIEDMINVVNVIVDLKAFSVHQDEIRERNVCVCVCVRLLPFQHTRHIYVCAPYLAFSSTSFHRTMPLEDEDEDEDENAKDEAKIQ